MINRRVFIETYNVDKKKKKIAKKVHDKKKGKCIIIITV